MEVQLPPDPAAIPHRFVTLDLMRGIAAVAVLLAHFGYFFGVNGLFQHGYLAVDFFFMLSGFVMVTAYQKRLDSGWSTLQFLKVRIIRLYPLYLVGLLLGFLFHLLRNRLGSVHEPFSQTFLLFLLGLFFLPAVTGPGDSASYLFPYDIPTWSLFYELFGNIVHALILRRRSPRFLAIWVSLVGIALALAVWKSGTLDLGYNRAQLGYGVLRVSFSYTFGILLYSVWQRRQMRWPVWLSTLILVLALLGVPSLNNRVAALYDIGVAVLIFPLLILVSASAPVPRWLVAPALIAGNASYAIYVLHVPLADWFQQLWLRIVGRHVADTAPWGGLVFLLLVVILAILLDRIVDIPVRALLRRRLRA